MDYYTQKKRADGGKYWISFTWFTGELYLLPTVRLGWGDTSGGTYRALTAGFYWLCWAFYGGLTKVN